MSDPIERFAAGVLEINRACIEMGFKAPLSIHMSTYHQANVIAAQLLVRYSKEPPMIVKQETDTEPLTLHGVAITGRKWK